MSIGTVLGNIAVGLFTNALGDAAKGSSKLQNIAHKLKYGETLDESRLRNHDLQRAVVRSYLRSIAEVHQLCITTLENQPGEYKDGFGTDIYKDTIKKIEKEINKLESMPDFEVPIHFDHLKFLLIPNNAYKDAILDINKLLVSNVPIKYTIDSIVFKDKLQNHVFDLMCKYFCYEIKFTKEVEKLFMAQFSVLQTMEEAEFREAILTHINQLSNKAQTDIKVVRENSEKILSSLSEFRDEFREKTKTLEEIKAHIQKTTMYTLTLSHMDGVILDSEDDFITTLLDLREEAKNHKMSTQCYEFISTVSFEVYLDSEIEVDREIRKLETTKKEGGSWDQEERQRYHDFKKTHALLKAKKQRIQKQILTFIHAVTSSSASLSMGLVDFGHLFTLSELSQNIIKRIIKRELTNEDRFPYCSSGHEKVSFINDQYMSFSVFLPEKVFQKLTDEYYIADIKDSQLLELILPVFTRHLVDRFDANINYRSAKGFALMGNWIISHPLRNADFDKQRDEIFKKFASHLNKTQD